MISNNLTRREKNAFIIVIILVFIHKLIVTDWEYVYLLYLVFPTGLYIATDPNRINTKGE